MRLRAAGAKADGAGGRVDAAGELPLGPLSEVSRAFGDEFASKVEAMAPGQWSGPVESPYGLHVVLVVGADGRRAAGPRGRASRASSASSWPSAGAQQLQALYERLLQKYTVSIEMPKDAKQ